MMFFMTSAIKSMCLQLILTPSFPPHTRKATSTKFPRHARLKTARPNAVAQQAPTSSTGLGRADFPILEQRIQGRPLVYLDNAATSQKPRQVLQALDEYYREYNSNVHRGVHALSARATREYELAREKVAAFVGARSALEIVFTRNASEAVNLVAQTWGAQHVRAGDEIVVSVAEHHSNLVPWQLLAQRTGAVLRHVPLTRDTQELDVDALRRLLGPRTKLVALVHASNVLGGVTPAETVCEMARAVGARVLLDWCQSVPNRRVDVQALGADWIVASGHTMCAPTGIGFLGGRCGGGAEVEGGEWGKGGPEN